jgi:polyphosphate glucokinase
MKILGIDIGGSGIKGAIVETKTGEFIDKRYRIPTPQPATPEAIGQTIKEIADYFNYTGIIGCGFPALMHQGVIQTASNIDATCKGVDANALFSKISGRKVKVYNDADVAGYAESKFGLIPLKQGLTLFLTIGTGIGSALISNGKLIENTEFGHIYMLNGLKTEHYASDAVRERENLDWLVWGARLNEVLEYLNSLFSPDLFILGGGASKKFDQFKDELKVNVRVEPASLLNRAGIVGAAMLVKKYAK